MTLRPIREELGLTQEELAAQIGVSRTTVTMWETGANTPPTKILPALAKALGCTIDELLSDDDEE